MAPGTGHVQACSVEVFLETERMRLRRFTTADVDLLVCLDRDPAVRRFVEDGRPVDRETATEDLRHSLDWYARSEVYGFWVAVEKATGRFLGWFHLRPAPDGPPDQPELGYRLLSDSWGRGYATEGSRALIDRGFQSSDAERIVAETMAVHVASRRVMEKAGMRYVGTFRTTWPVHIPGDEAGDVEYAITRAEWEAGRT